MIEQGFIKLHRSILKWEWYDDANTMRLFLHLLLTVNYEPKKWHGRVIERGERVCSYATLAKETRLSVQEIRTALNRLISTGEVTKESNPQYTVLSIKNYCSYQEATSSATNEQQTPNKRATNDQQQCKKDKESNKKVKEIYTPSEYTYGANAPSEKSTRFIPPTIDEVQAYCRERNNKVDPETFIDFYTSKGWIVGKAKMKDWKSAVRTWERNRQPTQQAAKPDRFAKLKQMYAEAEGK